MSSRTGCRKKEELQVWTKSSGNSLICQRQSGNVDSRYFIPRRRPPKGWRPTLSSTHWKRVTKYRAHLTQLRGCLTSTWFFSVHILQKVGNYLMRRHNAPKFNLHSSGEKCIGTPVLHTRSDGRVSLNIFMRIAPLLTNSRSRHIYIDSLLI